MREQLLIGMEIHIYFSKYKELILFRNLYGNYIWLKYHLYAKSNNDFNMTEFWHKHIQVMEADVMGIFVNDVVINENCFEIAYNEFKEEFPNYDGILGMSTIAGKDTFSFGKHYQKGEPIPHIGCSLIGRKFAERFPDYQFFCPDYWHRHPCPELLRTASEWGKVKLSTEATHHHLGVKAWYGREDWVNKSLYKRFRKNDDTVFTQRKKRRLCWGLDLTLIREEVLCGGGNE